MEEAMSRMDLFKGIGMGIIAGGAVGFFATTDRRRAKKMKGRAIRTIGTVMENVADIFGG